MGRELGKQNMGKSFNICFYYKFLSIQNENANWIHFCLYQRGKKIRRNKKKIRNLQQKKHEFY